MRPHKLDPQIGICCHALSLFSREVEMEVREKALQYIEDHNHGINQVEHKLSKVAKLGKHQFVLVSLMYGDQQVQDISKDNHRNQSFK